MSNEDWYRNEDWSEEIETAFFAKLKRARRKEQYLRIQASTISKTYPDIALSLLEQYFSLEDDFDHAQAYCDMASTYLCKGEVENAIDSYAKALDREDVFPNLKTEAYLLYSLKIVENKITSMYQTANEILDKNESQLMFPVDYFRWHAVKAIIAGSLGNNEIAIAHAENALDAAQIKKSGLSYHQNLGLVGDKYKGIVDELRAIYA